MSIVTKTGDAGATALMYNRRVPKCDPRVEAYGTVDELNAALGLVRALARQPRLEELLLPIQKDLVVLMGELATHPDDLPRYARDGFGRVSAEFPTRLDRLIQEVKTQSGACRGWATPGGSAASAALDLARTVCRRAERRVCVLRETGQLQNAVIITFLNRLSDLLWLLARLTDAPVNPAAAGA